MRNQQLIKIFLILILSTAYIFSFSQFGALAYNNIFGKDDVYGPSTLVGNVDLSGLTPEDAALLFEESTDKWKKETNIQLAYKEKVYQVDPSAFIFHADETMNSIINKQKNAASVTLSEDKLTEMILDTSLSLSSAEVDKDNLLADMIAQAATLDPSESVFHLENYISGSQSKALDLSSAEVVLGSEEKEIKNFVKSISSLDISAKSQFSLLDSIGKGQKFSSPAASKVATAIYGAILPTNFSIIERHISRELPEYSKIGFEAYLNPDKHMDFVFFNGNDVNYKLIISIEKGVLKVTLNGQPFLNKYAINLKDQKEFKQRTIKQYDPKLPIGMTETARVGKAGMIVKVYRDTRDEAGELLKSTLVSEDFYAPVHRIEKYSLTVPAASEQDSDSIDEILGSDDSEQTEEADSDTSLPDVAEQPENQMQEEQGSEETESDAETSSHTSPAPDSSDNQASDSTEK
ncbi:hypothetical protein [Peribacillus sp. SCS-155]|uniref:hypothetical protein n=1 Tax=Peribacillus sedimenti TaxID=3115297 RepID=UPI003905ED4D